MHIALGIDTGGTYTDAILLDQDNDEIIASAKAFTTYRDLSIGINNAIEQVLTQAAARVQPADVAMVGLSTTLATNAIVEGQGAPITLILIGYDRDLIHNRAFEEDLVTRDVVYIRGGHDAEGNPLEKLDLEAAREAIQDRMGRTAAFAVSGYFSVRNPDHELQVKALIEALTGGEDKLSLPVTCGHELTTKLNSIRRATTAALNARLIPILRDLILTVRGELNSLGVQAPLMIVKGDGSLVRSEWATLRPIETILSGPAASVVGAWHIAGREDSWVVDVGGTTTDIAALREGRPRLNPRGAQVGKWRTMVEAADVHTVGLGGDSHVRLQSNGSKLDLTIGPRRVLPLCRLAVEHPEVIEKLASQRKIKRSRLKPYMGQFLAPRRLPSISLSPADANLVHELQKHPVSLIYMAQAGAYRMFLDDRIERLLNQQVALRVGFTPTDALHVLGRLNLWNAEASRLGAELLAMQYGVSTKELCEQVVERMSNRVATELVNKVLNDEIGPSLWDAEPAAAGLLARAFGAVQNSDLACSLTLQHPVVAVGAPVEAYLPRSAEQLHTELVIPQQAGVANAIGAVVGSVVQRATATIRSIEFGEMYRLHISGNLGLDQTVLDFLSAEEALEYASSVLPDHTAELARQSGAEHVEVQTNMEEHVAPIREKIDQNVFLETVLRFTAVGRPASTVQAD